MCGRINDLNSLICCNQECKANLKVVPVKEQLFRVISAIGSNRDFDSALAECRDEDDAKSDISLYPRSEAGTKSVRSEGSAAQQRKPAGARCTQWVRKLRHLEKRAKAEYPYPEVMPVDIFGRPVWPYSYLEKLHFDPEYEKQMGKKTSKRFILTSKI